MIPLINNIEDFKKYVSNISSSTSFAMFENEISAATIEYIIPMIGEELNDLLATANSIQEYLIVRDKFKRALANYAALKYTLVSDTFFTQEGLKTTKSETQTTAYEYQKRDRMAKYAHDADVFMDDALESLERNKAFFPNLSTRWQKDSEKLFIRSASDFQKHVNIGNSRRTFMRLIPSMIRVEMLHITPILGQEIVENIKMEMTLKTLSQANAKLLSLIAPAVANMTIAKAYDALMPFDTMADGYVLSSFYKEAPNEKDIRPMAQAAKTDAESFLTLLAEEKTRQNQQEDPNLRVIPNDINNKHFIIS